MSVVLWEGRQEPISHPKNFCLSENLITFCEQIFFQIRKNKIWCWKSPIFKLMLMLLVVVWMSWCEWKVKCGFCRANAKKLQPLLAGSDLANAEETIMASFDFLASENVDDDDNDDDDEDDDGMANGDSYNSHDTRAAAEQIMANRFQVFIAFVQIQCLERFCIGRCCRCLPSHNASFLCIRI